MRRRILVVVVSAVVLAIALFGFPLALAVQRSISNAEQDDLERLALKAALSVSPGFRHDPIELPRGESGEALAVYQMDGSLVTGDGPPTVTFGPRKEALQHVVTVKTEGQLVVFVPISSGERVIAVARAASPLMSVEHRVWKAWAGLFALALLATGCAGALAAVQSRRLSRPLIALERAATDLGNGNFTVTTERSGVPEIDRASVSLDGTARRLADLIARERDFSAHASHQLRTPLTTLRLQLETGLRAGPDTLERAAVEAVKSADRLEQTIDDVLTLARRTERFSEGFHVEQVLDDVRQTWHGALAAANRPLRFVVDEEDLSSTASRAATRQILDVLVGNALRHGSGAVTVRARESAGALAFDVLDEGAPSARLFAAVAGSSQPGQLDSGLGLRLARSLAHAESGRLLIGSEDSPTRVTLLLPATT